MPSIIKEKILKIRSKAARSRSIDTRATLLVQEKRMDSSKGRISFIFKILVNLYTCV